MQYLWKEFFQSLKVFEVLSLKNFPFEAFYNAFEPVESCSTTTTGIIPQKSFQNKFKPLRCNSNHKQQLCQQDELFITLFRPLSHDCLHSYTKNVTKTDSRQNKLWRKQKHKWTPSYTSSHGRPVRQAQVEAFNPQKSLGSWNVVWGSRHSWLCAVERLIFIHKLPVYSIWIKTCLICWLFIQTDALGFISIDNSVFPSRPSPKNGKETEGEIA